MFSYKDYNTVLVKLQSGLQVEDASRCKNSTVKTVNCRKARRSSNIKPDASPACKPSNLKIVSPTQCNSF